VLNTYKVWKWVYFLFQLLNDFLLRVLINYRFSYLNIINLKGTYLRVIQDEIHIDKNTSYLKIEYGIEIVTNYND